jgi:hypothetical protein
MTNTGIGHGDAVCCDMLLSSSINLKGCPTLTRLIARWTNITEYMAAYQKI